MRTRAVLLLLSFLIANGAGAGVWRVEKDGSGDFMVIQDAVDAAASGDTILIGPGRYQDFIWYPDLNGANVAYWDDARDLTFLGTGSAEVIIGPETYTPVGTGPAGITNNQDVVLRVENLSFVNLKLGISSYYGEVHVVDSKFIQGDSGMFIGDPRHLEVYNCSFQDFDYSVISFRAQHAEIANCQLEDAVISLNDTDNGIVRNCTVTSGSLVRYSLSQGLVEDCDAQCSGNDPCIGVSDSDTVRFYDNVIVGGSINMSIGGANTHVFAERNDFSWPGVYNFDLGSNASFYAHDNHINRSSGMIDYIIYTTTYSHSYERTIDMGSNYWFADGTVPGRLDDLIHDGNDDPSLNIIVNYKPVRTEPVPTEKKSFGGLKAMYR